MIELIVQYQQTLKATRKLRENQTEPEQMAMVNGMIHDLEYALNWMRCGDNPEKYLDGKQDQAFYHRRVLLNMDMFPCLDIEPTYERKIPDEKKWIVQKILSGLTERQLTCFLLHAAHMRSFQEVADELGLTKATVQKHIEKARNRIKEIVNVS